MLKNFINIEHTLHDKKNFKRASRNTSLHPCAYVQYSKLFEH